MARKGLTSARRGRREGGKTGTWSSFERWADRKPRPVPEPALGIGITKDMLMSGGRRVIREDFKQIETEKVAG